MQSMSKYFRPFLLTTAAAVLILQLFNKSPAQDVFLHVIPERKVVHVDLKMPEDQADTQLIFLSGYAGGRFRYDRISNIRQANSLLSYDVDLSNDESSIMPAQMSWLEHDGGILRLRDLLPQKVRKRGLVNIDIPAVWKVITPENAHGRDGYPVEDFETAAFYITRSFRGYAFTPAYRGKVVPLSFDISGRWQFEDGKATDVALSVFAYYGRLFESYPRDKFHLYLGKHPDSRRSATWEANTQAGNITVLSTETAFESQSLQRLHEQLRHEMFHLWIPEGVRLKGTYDWFYEGFALYQSLKLGVTLNRLRFDDYLDTLSRTYDVDRRLGGKMSLIDASKSRWSGDNNTVVYARGLLVAFLCDIALLNASKGKQSTDDIVREVYRRHRGDAAERDGNEAVMSLMKEHRELVPIVDNYVSGIERLGWDDLIRAAGLQAETKSGLATLSVVAKPDSKQKRLLDKLGYNNWRKLISK